MHLATNFKMLAHEYHGRTLQPWDDKYPESWGLVQEDGTLTNGGLLFSDNCEVYQSRVFCTRWNGLTKTDAINDAEYSGNLLYLLQMMRGFIKSNLPSAAIPSLPMSSRSWTIWKNAAPDSRRSLN